MNEQHLLDQLVQLKELNFLLNQRIQEQRLLHIKLLKKKQQQILLLTQRLNIMDSHNQILQRKIIYPFDKPKCEQNATQVDLGFKQQQAFIKNFVEKIRIQPLTNKIDSLLDQLLKQFNIESNIVSFDRFQRWTNGQLKHQSFALISSGIYNLQFQETENVNRSSKSKSRSRRKIFEMIPQIK